MKLENNIKYIGIRLNKSKTKWEVKIGHNYKKIYLGYFLRIKDAIEAYDNKAIELFGENVITNKKMIEQGKLPTPSDDMNLIDIIKDLPNETWENIQNYDGMYQVSNLGRIKSLDRITFNNNMLIGRLMKNRKDKDGYLLITLSKNGKVKTFKIHRLVAEAFMSNLDNLPQINHKNGIKSDNYVENLEWCDNSYNQRHALETGLRIMPRGESHYISYLKEIDIINIRQLKKEGISDNELALKYNVSSGHIWSIANRKCWKHIE